MYASSLLFYVAIFLHFTVPLVPPVASVSATTNDTVSIAWETLTMQLARGILTKFEIFGCTPLADGNDHCLNETILAVADQQNYEHVVTDLYPGTGYVLNITACTRIGCGVSRALESPTLEMGKFMLLYAAETIHV